MIRELRPAPEPMEVFARLSMLQRCLFLDSALLLDSALPQSRLARYSYVMADPFQWIEAAVGDDDPLALLAAALTPCQSTQRGDLPPFQGGAAGLLSYELGRSLETLPAPVRNPLQLPILAMGLYDVVVAFDHERGQTWIVSQGWPETDARKRAARAAQRLDQFRHWILDPPASTSLTMGSTAGSMDAPLSLAELQPLFPVEPAVSFPCYSNFSRASYCAAVQRGMEHVFAGDIFQVNLAQQLWVPAQTDALTLYRHLRIQNPATFAAYFDLGTRQILSASPERFVTVAGRQVETRPIKGTRPRRIGPEADLFAGDDLRYSDKDRAENVMIVDLMRNDLSRVCTDESVHVTQLCEVEHYQYVQHLVSAVTGTLRDDMHSIDLLRAAFPGGSITGAPKIRAMEIIAQIEPHARGAYCGSLGYINWDGSLDLSILIRTLTAGRGWWQIPVGGGIVAQSDPLREYHETWHKAAGMLRGIDAAMQAQRQDDTSKEASRC